MVFCITTAICAVALVTGLVLSGSKSTLGIVGAIIILIPMLCFSIGLFLRLRRGKKQEKTAKFSYSEEESNSESGIYHRGTRCGNG